LAVDNDDDTPEQQEVQAVLYSKLVLQRRRGPSTCSFRRYDEHSWAGTAAAWAIVEQTQKTDGKNERGGAKNFARVISSRFGWENWVLVLQIVFLDNLWHFLPRADQIAK
jgi:hypothetical protein